MARHTFKSSFLGVVFSARIAFSKRSWPYVVSCAVPWLLCSGQRCMTRLAALGRHRRSLSSYYRFLSDGKWRLNQLSKSLFDLIVAEFKITELTVVLDDTLCPKWGRHIFGTGYHYDHVARPRKGTIWGHCWVVLAVVVQVGSTGWVALPFWFALYRQEKYCPKELFRTRHELAVQALRDLRRWFTGPITLLADGAYNNRSLAAPARELGLHLVSRLRDDARLRRPQPPRPRKGRPGRKPKHGPALSRLPALARATNAFREVQVQMYGKSVTLRLREIVGYWPPLKAVVKVVISRDPRNRRRTAYLMTTNLDLDAVRVVELFARRWTIEQLFSVAKNQMGLDSPEVRKEHAVRRHAAFCFALVTWMHVWIHRYRPALWQRSFASKLAELRSETIANTIFSSGPRCNSSRYIASSVARIYATATAVA